MTQPTPRGSPSQLPHTTAGSTTATQSHTTAAGDDALIVLAISNDNNPYTISGAYNGVPLVSIGSVTVTGTTGLDAVAQAFILVNPPVGTYDVVLTFSGNTLTTITVQSFDNVNTTTPTVGFQTTSQGTAGATGSSTTASPGATANDIVIGYVFTENTVSVSTTDTAIGVFQRDAVTFNNGVAHAAYSASQSTIDFSFSGGSDSYIAFAFVLQGTGGGGGGAVSHRNGIALSGVSAINGISKSSVSHINGLTI